MLGEMQMSAVSTFPVLHLLQQIVHDCVLRRFESLVIIVVKEGKQLGLL